MGNMSNTNVFRQKQEAMGELSEEQDLPIKLYKVQKLHESYSHDIRFGNAKMLSWEERKVEERRGGLRQQSHNMALRRSLSKVVGAREMHDALSYKKCILAHHRDL